MVKSKSFGARVFVVVNALVIGLLAASCLIPLIHVFAISLSDKSSASGGLVTLWSVNFTLESYKYVINRAPFWTAMLVSLKRVLVGVSLNMFFCIICAYPLSKETNQFRARTAYAWYFFITMLISGGMIPLYMVINLTGLKGTFWSLVIPGAVPVYNIILLLNFFRQTPRELEEAAIIDGSNDLITFVRIILPLSAPVLASVSLFYAVSHWNSYFNAMLYINNSDMEVITIVLRRLVFLTTQVAEDSTFDWGAAGMPPIKAVKMATTVLSTLPILCIYPFVQKFFTQGVMVGSVKG